MTLQPPNHNPHQPHKAFGRLNQKTLVLMSAYLEGTDLAAMAFIRSVYSCIEPSPTLARH